MQAKAVHTTCTVGPRFHHMYTVRRKLRDRKDLDLRVGSKALLGRLRLNSPPPRGEGQGETNRQERGEMPKRDCGPIPLRRALTKP